MEAKFSQSARNVLKYSREEALRLGNSYIGTEHLMLGIVRMENSTAVQILKDFGVEIARVKKRIEDAVIQPDKETIDIDKDTKQLPLIKQAEKALKITYLEAKSLKSDLIGTEHLLLALLKDTDNLPSKTLKGFNVVYEDVKIP